MDPFRADTRRWQAEWFAQQFHHFYPGKNCHLRGLHYRCFAAGNLEKPKGGTYQNTHLDWLWLVRASGDARWLGLVPFERIFDGKNEEPIVIERPKKAWQMVCRAGSDLSIPSADDLSIEADIEDMVARQPFTLAIYGEKGSLYDIAEPICQRFGADLYLPSGDLSTTHIHRMAKQAVEDRRELILFTLTDCDPCGYNMAIAVARKLQALQCGLFPNLKYRLIRIAIDPGQAAELDLPSTPLKPKEQARGERWREKFGRGQTEIDAALALCPDDLRNIIEKAMLPFFDETLEERTKAALEEWREAAESEIEDRVGDDLEAIRDEYGDRIDGYNETLGEINDRLDEARSRVSLPRFEAPRPIVKDHDCAGAIIDSEWSWLKQTETLLARKAYEDDGKGDGDDDGDDLDEAA